MLRNCRHLQLSYTKTPLKRAAINIKHFICIVIKEFYNPIKNIAYILEELTQFES